MKIYTKTGDAGTTGLLGSGRVAKDDLRIEAYGTVDELNAVLGCVRASGLDAAADSLVGSLQDDLFAVGSALADPDPTGRFHTLITVEHARRLEAAIDSLESELPALTQFIVPGGSPAGAQVHLARTVARRAERRVVQLCRQPGEQVPVELIVYLNRLSDLLFVLARAVNQRAGVADVPLEGPGVNLTGKNVLITGARRVGGLLARLLAERGASIALTYYTSRATIEGYVSELREAGVKSMALPADLSQADQANRAVAAVVENWGRLDVLVNMASIYRRTPFDALIPGDFDAMIAANLAAPYHASVAAGRQMRAQAALDEAGLKGKIVMVGDWATDRPYKDYLPYLVAKGGLTTLTLALARELAPEVTVNLVQPAMIDAPPDLTSEEQRAVRAATPLRRFGVPDDLNRLILYLLEGTDFATGGSYRVDGGRFLGDS